MFEILKAIEGVVLIENRYKKDSKNNNGTDREKGPV